MERGSVFQPAGTAGEVEKRRAERVKVGLKVLLQADHPVRVGPGITSDVSQGGICVMTRHELHPGQQIEITIPTHACPGELGLPGELRGRAVVQRVEEADHHTRKAALRFLPGLAHSMEWAFFMAFLLGVQPSPMMAS